MMWKVDRYCLDSGPYRRFTDNRRLGVKVMMLNSCCDLKKKGDIESQIQYAVKSIQSRKNSVFAT